MENKTRVIVRALTEKGKEALKIHRAEEEDFRKKANLVPKFARPKKLKEFLKTKSEFTDDSHVLTGFAGDDENSRTFFYESVKKTFLENGATLDDFEVKFDDD